MNKARAGTVLVVWLTLVGAHGAGACTTFCLQHGDALVFGRTFDWDVAEGMLVVNKRGVQKQSVMAEPRARWISEHGSVTFNQHGREFPLGGMNDAGLVIECMWLNDTVYPPPDARPALMASQWIQYQLDMSARLDDVLANMTRVRIGGENPAALHFLVCDRNGDCAAIEFLAGRVVIHRAETLPWPVLTNHPYEEARDFLRRIGDDRSSTRFHQASRSLRRFAWAADGVAHYDPTHDRDPAHDGDAIAHAFTIIDRVTVPRTLLRVVYDLTGGRIHFDTGDPEERRHVDMRAFDYDCETPVLILDLATAGSGDVRPDFEPYTEEANLRLIRASFSKTDFLRHVPDEQLRRIAAYPGQLPCVSGAIRNRWP